MLEKQRGATPARPTATGFKRKELLALCLCPVAAMVLAGGMNTAQAAFPAQTGRTGNGTSTGYSYTGATVNVTAPASAVNSTNSANSTGVEQSPGSGSATMNITGTTGTVTVTTTRGTGILVNPTGTAANATINIGGSDNAGVNNTDATHIIVNSNWSPSVDGNDGIEATTHGTGTAIVNIGQNVTGQINVNGGGNGIWIDSLGTGNVVGNILATGGPTGLIINNNRTNTATPTGNAPSDVGNTIAGIMGWTSFTAGNRGGAGIVTITNAATVITSGLNVDGINTQTANGKNTVINSGTITTDGSNSHGIIAVATGIGTVDVQNSGSIKTGLSSIGTNSTGIEVTSNGNVSVENSAGGDITTNTDDSMGIKATTTGSNMTSIVTNDASITTNGINSAAIYSSTQNGESSVTNSADLTTAGNTSAGINVVSQTGQATVIDNGTNTTIATTGDKSQGIYATSQGPVTVDTSLANGSKITTVGDDSQGIAALSTGAGDVKVTNNENIETGNGTTGSGSTGIEASSNSGDSEVDNIAATITTNGDNSPAISSTTTGDGASSTVINNGELKTNGLNTANSSDSSPGIIADSLKGPVNVGNTGNITTVGDNSQGIMAISRTTTNTADTTDAYAVTVVNRGNIQTGSATAGEYSHGIAAQSAAGNVTVINSAGTITTNGNMAVGILATTTGVEATSIVNTTGTTRITTSGPESPAILSLTSDGDNTVTNTAALTTTGNSGDFPSSDGILAVSGTGTITVTNSGAIHTEGAGSNGIEAMTSSGDIEIDNRDSVTSDKGVGILATATGDPEFTLTNEAEAKIFGNTAGVQISDNFTPATITNAGTIGALTDLAIDSSALTTAPLTITNNASGIINGYVTLGSADGNTLTNAGTWNLSNYNSVTNVQGVAVADFGSGSGNTINNIGTITLAPLQNQITNVPAGAVNYAPLSSGSIAGSTDARVDNPQNDPIVNRVAAGQILGVASFTNSGGTIDLTGGGQNAPGSVLVISGGHTAGQDGGGVYNTSGGTIMMNTVQNAGGAVAQSDVLVVDSVKNVGGQDQLSITLGGTPTHTTGDGIPVVEVLNAAKSDPNAFKLAGPVGSGFYAYQLYNTTLANNGTDVTGNYYLRNTIQNQENPGDPPPDESTPGITPPPIPPPSGTPIYRVAASTYTAIPSMALLYGRDQISTLHQRVGEEEDSRGRKDWHEWTPQTGAWARVFATHGTQNGNDNRSIYSRGIYSGGDAGPEYDYDFFGIQVGQDLLRKEHDRGSRDLAGVYFAYGHATGDVTHPFTSDGNQLLYNLHGRNQVGIYTLGGYWTHFGESGWYTDALVQGSYYDITSRTYASPDMTTQGVGWAASLEAGKPFRFDQGYFIEPQAQITYQLISFDDGYDKISRVAFDNADSLAGRIGARFGHDWNLKRDRQMTAWIRPNIWHEFRGDTTTKLSGTDGSGATPFEANLGGTWGEINIGLSGQVTPASRTGCTTSLYANVSYDRSFEGNGDAWVGDVGIRFAW